MALASALCLLLVGVVVGAGLVLVAVPVAGFVWYAVDVLAFVLPVPVATVLAVAAVALSLFAVELALRSLRTARENADSVRSDPIAEGVVELGAYVLLLSSLLVALAVLPFAAGVLPAPVFAALVVFGAFYLLTISYVWAARVWVRSRSDDADRLERSAAGDQLLVAVLAVGYMSLAYSELFAVVLVVALVAIGLGAILAPGALDVARNRLVAYVEDGDEDVDPEKAYHGIAEEARQIAAGLERAPGPRPTLLVALVGAALLLGSYAATTIWPFEALAVAVGAVAASAFVGGHFVGAIRGEFGGNAAVLRNLELEGDLDRDSVAETTVDDRELADIRTTVARLAGQADVPVPDLRLVDRRTPTALAVGYRPATSTIVLSRGIVNSLEGREFEAVLAHELAHVANRDAAVLTALSAPGSVARTATGRYGFNPVLEPLAMLTNAVSRAAVAFVARGREYAADDAAVAITGDPAGLASALETLDTDLERRPESDLRERDVTAAFSIVPPPWEEQRFFDRTRRLVARGLFGTHPATERRIDRLRIRT
ncbi:heat shock protein HtpX [Natronococcus amylolyticus DSM 10524]|uniref:Heat shock protein HtpX n=1 Tax=Natronococcus amylolyticus DSM 10524 TaxID=1227497 RepID=L9XFD7_9EURY|nr:M48 family metalloprotease [Natronococcus amylolyticus]ELY60430.1 heat shock protein HtpX [Natronococcus amylolyticus DSM 10524]